MVAIPTNDTISGNINDAHLIMVLNPQSNTPLTQGYGHMRAHMRNGVVTALTLNSNTLTVTREGVANQTITLPNTPGGTSGPRITASGAAPSGGSNGDVHIQVSETAGELTNVTSIHSNVNGMWAELQDIVSATQENIYVELKNILQQGTNSPLTFNDTESEVTVNDTQGSGGDGGTVAFGLVEVGNGNIGTTAGQLGSITKDALSDWIFLDVSYTRTNSDLRMSGWVEVSEIPHTTGEYKFQVQGAGGDYIALRFDDGDADAELDVWETTASITSATMKVWNPTAGTASDDSGVTILHGTAVPLRQTGDWYFQNPDSGDTLVLWRWDGSTWVEHSETTHVEANPTGTDGNTITRIKIKGTNWKMPAALPAGGTAGQVLAKNSANDGYVWVNQAAGGGSVSFANSKSPDTASGTNGSATTAARSDHAHSRSSLYAAAAHGTHVTFGTATSRDTTSGSGGSAATVARSDHAHARSALYAQSAHTHGNAIARIPSASPGNNKVWKTNNSGVAAWRDESASGSGSWTWVKPSTSQDYTGNSTPAQEVWASNQKEAMATAVGGLSSPSAGDRALTYFQVGTSIFTWIWTYDGQAWAGVETADGTTGANYRSKTGGSRGSSSGDGANGRIEPFTIETIFPRGQFVNSGSTLYFKETDTSSLPEADQPNLADRQAWTKLFPRDIPELLYPSYQGNSDWESITAPVNNRRLHDLDDITNVFSGHTIVIELDAELPDDFIGTTTAEIVRTGGGEISPAQQVKNGRHFYCFHLTYDIVPDLELAPLRVEIGATATGTIRFRHLSAYHLDGYIDDQSWEMYKLNLDTLEERASELESRLPFKGQWKNRAFYRRGDVVYNGAHPTTYVRLTDMPGVPTENQDGPRGDRTNWTPVGDWMGTWTNGGYYSPGNVVERNISGDYRYYMAIAEIHLGTNTPESSPNLWRRIDNVSPTWAAITDKPAVRNNFTSPDGDQIIYLTGSDNAHTDEDRRATLSLAVGTTNGTVTPAERTKLQDLPADAEANVSPDWNAANGEDGHILNKPALAPSNAEANVRSNWNETDTSSDAYIWNKPTIPTLRTAAQTARLMETLSGNDRYDYEALKNKPTINSGDVNVNADWDVTDADSDGYIRNKPDINHFAQDGRSPLKSEWTTGTQYHSGDIVSHLAHIYTTNTDHVATDQNGPRGQNSVWHSRLELRVETSLGPVLGSVTSPSHDDDLQTLSLNGWMYDRGTYNNGYTYYKQNIVERNGTHYIAKRQTNGNPPESSPNDWKQFGMTPAATGVQNAGIQTLSLVVNSVWRRVGTMSTTDIPSGKIFAIELVNSGSHSPQLLEFQCWFGNASIPEINVETSPRADGFPALLNSWGTQLDEPTRVPLRLGRVGNDLYVASSNPLIAAGLQVRFDWLP